MTLLLLVRGLLSFTYQVPPNIVACNECQKLSINGYYYMFDVKWVLSLTSFQNTTSCRIV